MPRYRIQIFKRLGAGGKEWSNVYHVVSPDLTEASGAASFIAQAETEVHTPGVTFIRARISQEVPASSLFATIPLNFVGVLANSGELLPLFNTVRVDWQVGGGRPSYKFLRGGLGEGFYTQEGITPTFQTIVQTEYADALFTLLGDATNPTFLVDEDGLPFSGVTVWPLVQMRQMSRRKRKKTV